MAAASPLARLRKLCLALPEAHEVEAWGAATFRVRKKLFAMYSSTDSQHSGGRPAVWCKAGPGTQQLMRNCAHAVSPTATSVGPSGGVGVYLDGDVDWAEVGELLRDAYRLVAPKRLAALVQDA